jgi:long-chain acyl-CoA synthetase
MSGSIDRPWLNSYPEGVPAEIDLDEFPSLVSLLDTCFDRFRHRPAFTNFGKTISYGELDELSRQFAAFLIHDLKCSKGDRIAMMMPNVLQYPIAICGALRAGLVVVNTNPMYTARELRHQLVDSGARVILVLDNFAQTLVSAREGTPVRHVITTGIGDMLGFPKSVITNFVVRHVKKMVPAFDIADAIRFRDALKRGSRHPVPKADVGPGDIAFLQYTGGTTGVAKGAMLIHRNLIANMQQASAWLGTALTEGEEVIITALPLYHIFALTANCLTFMKIGGHNHLITNPRDMPGFVAELRKIRYTAITGVNTLFNGLLNTPGFDQLDFSRLRMTLGGGMAVQRSVAERWKKVTGSTLAEAYGLTETSPAVCINPLDLSAYNGSIGLPVPSTDVSIRGEDGQAMSVGGIGELCVRGPQVMQGYWNRPEETANVIDADGWLHTGDIGRMDEKGYFYIVDRKKDMILVSGFNVYPNEIEDVVALMPGVLEVAAIGVPDEKTGEAVKLVVVKRDPALSAEAIRAHCKAQLTGYKQPRYIQFRDSLPKSNVGKILRRELRDEATTPA